jgi:hypothetical protein
MYQISQKPVKSLGNFRSKFINAFNVLKPTGQVMHHKFNTQQLYNLPTLYLFVVYLSHNKQRILPHIA